MVKLEEIEYQVPQGIRESILTVLRQAIISGKLKPGERLTERMLSRHFGTSTMPVKEALRIMEAEGLVETKPRRGTYVSGFASMHLAELLAIRATIEGLAANFAARKASTQEIAVMERLLDEARALIECGNYAALVKKNTEIHEAIYLASGNSFVKHLVQSIASYGTISRRVTLTSPEEQRLGWEEHASVVAAIKDRDPEQAEQRLRQHIMRSAEMTLRMQAEGTGWEGPAGPSAITPATP